MRAIDPRDRVAVFIDGEFLFKGLEATMPGARLDYSKLVDKLVQPGRITRAWFYTAPPPGYWGPERISARDTWMSRIRGLPYFHVVMGRNQKRTRRVLVEAGGEERLVTGTCWEQKGVDVRLAIDMVSKARLGEYDAAVLVSGDGDFVALVLLLQDMGKHIVNARCPPNPARRYHPSSRLRRACDHCIAMDEAFLKDWLLLRP